MRLSRLALTTCLLAASGLLALAAPAAPQATPYVPLGDPAYRDLDALAAAGWVHSLVLGQRPYSMAAFRRASEEARAWLEAGASPPRTRHLEALERLEARFLDASAPPSTPPPRPTLRGALAGASWADSPSRAVVSRYQGDPDLIDADVNPLLQRNQGRALHDGITVAAEAWGDVRLGSRLAAAVHPRLFLAAPAGGGAEAGFALVRGYARGLLGNLSVEAGRNDFTHGRARELGPLFSGNARGLDQVRVSLERPGRLPWILRYLGPVGFAGTVATLGQDLDTPGSILVVWEGALRPHRNLELGLGLTSQQGGENAPPANLGERLREVFFIQMHWPFVFLPMDREIGDKMVSLRAALSLPRLGAEAYLEVATTDLHWGALDAQKESFTTEAAWTGGVRVLGLGADGRWDAWVEAAHNGVRPYTHHQFTSGFTLDRRIVGSPLGPLATGFQAGLDRTGPRDRLSVAGAWERYCGDEYIDLEPGPLRWIRVQDNPDEIRLRATLDWERQSAATGLRTTARLGYEHVTRFDFTDRNRSNFLAQVGMGWVW